MAALFPHIQSDSIMHGACRGIGNLVHVTGGERIGQAAGS